MTAADLPWLEALARRFPTRAAALAEMAHLQAVLTLPKGTVHVVSDVHGEARKLSHVIRNASGSLRVLIDQLFADLDDEQRSLTLRVVYYAEQTWRHRGLDVAPRPERDAFFFTMLPRLVTLARTLATTWSDRAVDRVLPAPYRLLFRELFAVSGGVRPDDDGRYLRALVAPFLDRGQGHELLRLLSRVVRNLSVYELVVAGDLGDRGPRLDKVVDVLMKQPRLAIAWGNHDVSWMGACLGQPALVATVVRISLRYGRTEQLEEGYGISLAPLERLAQKLYADDPLEKGWRVKLDVAGRDADVVARMQKAIAVIQWKLEGQLIAAHPEYAMDDRRLLRALDLDDGSNRGTITVDGVAHPLRDTHFPTIDRTDPERLSADEQACLDALRESFTSSSTLWAHMQFVRKRGAMLLRRDMTLIFHGCVPVDDAGEPLSLVIDGVPQAGPALFAAFERVVHRAFRERRATDVDWLWYLWTGARSPLFGKDKMATIESQLVDDAHAKHETKNAYFKLQHDVAFCDRVLTSFGVDPAVGLIVNGHVPVKLENGETALKKSGKAVTIDGAFSEAYGDKGFTLILEARRIALAEHHHFDSVDSTVDRGSDIVPVVTDLRTWSSPRRVGDTEAGSAIRREVEALSALVAAFDDNVVVEADV
ncbi:MAG TPA: fructose-bisphosphatase class III [Myxococcota bacterium]